MSKRTKRRFTTYKPQPQELASESFRLAVKQAERIVIATIEQKGKLAPAPTMVLLALYTKSVIIGKCSFNASDQEIRQLIFYILNDPNYIPGEAFPYTKEQLLAAGRIEHGQ